MRSCCKFLNVDMFSELCVYLWCHYNLTGPRFVQNKQEKYFHYSKSYLQPPTVVVLLNSFRTPNERNRLNYGIICIADYLLPTPRIFVCVWCNHHRSQKTLFLTAPQQHACPTSLKSLLIRILFMNSEIYNFLHIQSKPPKPRISRVEQRNSHRT